MHQCLWIKLQEVYRYVPSPSVSGIIAAIATCNSNTGQMIVRDTPFHLI